MRRPADHVAGLPPQAAGHVEAQDGSQNVRTTLNSMGTCSRIEKELVAALDRRSTTAADPSGPNADHKHRKAVDLDDKRATDLALWGVDQRGIEPLTSPVRGVRSTN